MPPAPQPDLPGLHESPPELTHPGPCGLCGCDVPVYGVALRALVVTLRATVGAQTGEQLLLFHDPLAAPVPRPSPRGSAYLPMTFDPTPAAPPRPTVGLCYRHTVAVVQLMRSWGDPPDGYDWVPAGLLDP